MVLLLCGFAVSVALRFSGFAALRFCRFAILRLCRLPCGKPPAFRQASDFFSGYAAEAKPLRF